MDYYVTRLIACCLLGRVQMVLEAPFSKLLKYPLGLSKVNGTTMGNFQDSICFVTSLPKWLGLEIGIVHL